MVGDETLTQSGEKYMFYSRLSEKKVFTLRSIKTCSTALGQKKLELRLKITQFKHVLAYCLSWVFRLYYD